MSEGIEELERIENVVLDILDNFSTIIDNVIDLNSGRQIDIKLYSQNIVKDINHIQESLHNSIKNLHLQKSITFEEDKDIESLFKTGDILNELQKNYDKNIDIVLEKLKEN